MWREICEAICILNLFILNWSVQKGTREIWLCSSSICPSRTKRTHSPLLGLIFCKRPFASLSLSPLSPLLSLSLSPLPPLSSPSSLSLSLLSSLLSSLSLSLPLSISLSPALQSELIFFSSSYAFVLFLICRLYSSSIKQPLKSVLSYFHFKCLCSVSAYLPIAALRFLETRIMFRELNVLQMKKNMHITTTSSSVWHTPCYKYSQCYKIQKRTANLHRPHQKYFKGTTTSDVNVYSERGFLF